MKKNQDLLIDPNRVQTGVHDVDPTVTRGQHEKRHQSLAKIIKVVLPVEPHVPLVRETVSFVSYILYVRTIAIEKSTLEQLDSEDPEYDEKGTTDENNVSNGSQRRKQGLDNELQSGSSIYHTQWPQ